MEQSDNLDDQMTVTGDGQKKLNNAGAILGLGIASIPLAGLIGLIMGISALGMANKSLAEYNKNPNEYAAGSYKNVNAGKICAIIGISVSAIWLIVVFGMVTS